MANALCGGALVCSPIVEYLSFQRVNDSTGRASGIVLEILGYGPEALHPRDLLLGSEEDVRKTGVDACCNERKPGCHHCQETNWVA
jgi:hypothetical protein